MGGKRNVGFGDVFTRLSFLKCFSTFDASATPLFGRFLRKYVYKRI